MTKAKKTAWGRFLGARAEMIHQMAAEGSGPTEIARALSCDPDQVTLISLTPLVDIVETEEWRAARAKRAK